MAFRLPNFNLTCLIWRNGMAGGNYLLPDVTSPCNLSPGRRVIALGQPPDDVTFSAVPMELLLPALVDIRAHWNGLTADAVEVPAGSKRFYSVFHVDDTAKGFANEYRLALMRYFNNGSLPFGFPAPLPLP
jgi:hypothetical protein